MKLKNILWSILVVWGCWACSEDDLTPAEPYHNFGPDADATDEESVLRREFFETNGFYLLFNDTIYKEYVGTDAEGEPFYKTETVDPAWSLTGMDRYTTYRFAYCETMAKKRERAEFVSGLVKIMTEHNLTTPYSVLVVDTITVITSKSTTHPSFLNSLRCFIIALPEIKGTDNEKYQLIANMAGNGISIKYAGELQAFYDIMESRWGSLYGDYHGGDGLEEHREVGFLEVVSSSYYPTQGEDVAAYIKMLLTMTDEEIRTKYPEEDYPKIIQKYELIRNVAIKAGIKLKS